MDRQGTKGGFPVMAETTRNHIFSKEISQVIIAAMVLAPNFYRKNCLRVISAMRGNPPQHSKQSSNSVKFHLILFYLGMYTIKLLLTEISVHTGNICPDIQGARTSLRSVHTP